MWLVSSRKSVQFRLRSSRWPHHIHLIYSSWRALKEPINAPRCRTSSRTHTERTVYPSVLRPRETDRKVTVTFVGSFNFLHRRARHDKHRGLHFIKWNCNSSITVSNIQLQKWHYILTLHTLLIFRQSWWNYYCLIGLGYLFHPSLCHLLLISHVAFNQIHTRCPVFFFFKPVLADRLKSPWTIKKVNEEQ